MVLSEELLFVERKSLPIFSSSEAAECGLVCLAMIAKFHGHDVDVNGLRQRFPISMQGASLHSIIEVASQLSFTSRALRIELEELSEVTVPAILHWNLNHFVVLREIRGGKAIIHDPSAGKRVLGMNEVSECFTGIVLELFPAQDFDSISMAAPIRFHHLWSTASGLTSSVGFVLVMSLVLQVFAFVAPFQMQLVIDQAIPRNDTNLLALICVSFSFVMLMQYSISAFRDYVVQIMGGQFVLQTTSNIVRHLLRLPISFFEKRHVGDIMSRLAATNVIRQTLMNGTISALIDGVMAFAAAVLLIVYAIKLALVILASFAVILIINIACYYPLKARQKNALLASATEQSFSMESIRAIKTIKLSGQEATREASWKNLYIRSMNQAVGSSRIMLVNQYLVNVVTAIQICLVIYLGATDVTKSTGFTIGMLTAFLSFRSTFMDRGLSFAQQVSNFKMLSVQLERLDDIVGQRKEGDIEAEPLDFDTGFIRFENISFRYGATDKWVFDKQSFQIEDGAFVAVVGPSGGGKSTLLKLLMGLHIPNAGDVYFGGQLASHALFKNWRRQIGVVLQDDNLLSGNISDNIASFEADVDLNRVIAAAKLARIDDEIRRMPMQYNTLIGDMGSSLSGGQKQRVLLARALYKSPKVLILDEGTANLDAENEIAIAEVINDLPITRIIVAHRPELIKYATHILQVKDGAITNIPVRHACGVPI